MKKKVLASALFGALLLSAASLAASAEGSNELVMIDSEWYGIDTYQLDGSSDGQSFLSSTMFAWDAENNCVVDNVCTDWQVSDDGLTITFNVPDDLYYCTGEQVLPEDIKASIEHGLEVSPYADGYSNIESIDIDGQQVTLNLEYYSSDMEYYFCADFMCIIDKDELDSMTNEELLWNCHPYAPYYLAEGGYVSGMEVNGVRYDGYKCSDPRVENHGAWAFDTVKFRFNIEDFTASEELKNGTVNAIMGLSMDQVLELQDVEGIEIVEAAYPCINYLELNTESPAFADIEARQAFTLALDRETVANIVENEVVPAYSMIYDTMQCFNQDVYDDYKENYCNNLEKACELLESAGWVDEDGDGIREKDGEKLEFTMYSWDSYSTIMEAFASQLAQAGFQMNIEFLEWNYIYDKIESDDYDAGTCSLGWAEPILIFNICYYDPTDPGNTDEYWDLVAAAAGESDPAARVEKVGEVEQAMMEQFTLVPIFGDNGWDAYGENLEGFKVLSDGTTPMNDLHFAE